MALKSMHDLFVEELRMTHDAERRAVRAYPKIVKSVASDKLKQAIEQHLEETKGQVERLEQVFEELDMRTRGKTCEAIRGFVEDIQDTMERGLPPELLDAALIAELQKVEHFEIASYGSLQAFATALGLDNATKLLQQTLDEEKAMDKRLNEIAIKEVNKTALELGGGQSQGAQKAQGIDRAAAGSKPGKEE